jgi:energy-coupling factor transporter ATP-binding protein EcfA2
MFFREVKLVRCNRMSLNGSETITIRPSLKTQMVLGSNGGGKSSLLHIAFCPLPPDPNWFDDGGSLHQIFDHKGHTYEIKCEYGDKNSYSFIVDGGENLNKGRTVTAQLELVRIHTGYTKDFHQLAIGNLEFTAMTSKQRQDWIAKLSPTNFDFAFAKYVSWRKMANSKAEIVKYLKDRLVEARGNLLEPDVIADMRAKSAELQATLEQLMRVPRNTADVLDDEEMAKRVQELDARAAKWLMLDHPDQDGEISLEELITKSADMGEAISSRYGEMRVREETLSKADHRRVVLGDSVVHDPEVLKRHLESAVLELEAIPEPACGLHPSLLIRASKPIGELRMAVAGLPDVRYTATDYNVLTQGLFDKKERLNRVSGLLEDLNRQVEHIHSCETVACPNCKTEFKPGIEEGKLDELKSRVDKGSVMNTELEGEVEEAEQHLQNVSRAVDSYARLDEIRGEYQSQFPGLFAWLDNCGWTSAGKALSSKIALYERDVIHNEQRNDYTKAIETFQLQLAKHESASGEASKVLKEFEEAHAAYEAVWEEIKVAEDKKRRLDTIIREWHGYESTYQAIEQGYSEIRNELISYCNHQGDLVIEDMIRKTKQSIGVHEYAISEQETHETLVKDLENQLKGALVQEEAYKRLTAEMCPKKGFLAEQISQQMASVINVINKLIKRVWGYPLYLHHCDVEETEITYKFPVTVDTKRRNDISEGSRSIKDVINQAFRLAAYYCMKLHDFPLFLDEIGSSFDEAHRHNLIPLIKDLVDDEHFSQVLIVSHTLDGQTAFPMSETIIMDDRNLNYPHAYNLHVEFA